MLYKLVSFQLTESKSAQAICHIYASVSYICIGDPDSYAKVNLKYNDLLIGRLFCSWLIYIFM